MTDERKLRWMPTGELRFLSYSGDRLLQQKWAGYPDDRGRNPIAPVPYPPPEPVFQWRLIPIVDVKGLSVEELGIVKLKDLPNDD